MNGLDTESRQVMEECLRMYGALNAVEAFMEYEHADRYDELPEGARFLQELIHEGDGRVFVWRDPDELRAQ